MIDLRIIVIDFGWKPMGKSAIQAWRSIGQRGLIVLKNSKTRKAQILCEQVINLKVPLATYVSVARASRESRS